MASQRILEIRDLIDDYDKLLKYVPIQDIEYAPKPEASVAQRFAGAVAANLDKSAPAHVPGSWLVGNGGYMFRKAAKPEWLLPEDYAELRDFPKAMEREVIDSLDLELFVAVPFMWGHVCVSIASMLKYGINGILDRVSERMSDPALNDEQRDFLEAAHTEWEAALRYEMKHRDFYDAMSAYAETAEERELYHDMARRIERTPAFPPESFIDALQAIWFFYLCLHCEDVGGHTMGRIDQLLIPYYRKDIENGTLTPELAEEYFFDFWLKFNLSHIILENNSENWALGNTETDLTASNGLVWTDYTDTIIRKKHVDDGFVIDIGGLDNNGRDASNEISWLVLKALNELGTLGMKPVLKYSDKTDPDFARACFETVVRIRNGFPAITFDQNSVRAFRMEPENSYTEEELNDICHIGCVELAVPGKSYTDPMNAFFNLPKLLLLTMNMGVLDEKRVGIPLAASAGFEEFFDAYLSQLGYFIKMYERTENAAAQIYNRKYKRPMVSTLIEGCIEKARFVDEGGAKYWFKCMNCVGLASTVDSLIAVKDVVFDKKLKTMEEFCAILANNFEGEEVLRQYLLNRLPKYGNGDKDADTIAVRLADRYCAAVSECRTWNGTPYRPGLYSYYGPAVNYGLHTGATPNGRLRGEPLSLNTDPDHGAIRSGLTGAAMSVTSFDQAKSSNASAIDIHLMPDTPVEVVKNLADYLGANGALYMQITVADREELLDAQLHPDKHKDLVVRVTGFSAHFIALDRETQDEIIARSYWT